MSQQGKILNFFARVQKKPTDNNPTPPTLIPTNKKKDDVKDEKGNKPQITQKAGDDEIEPTTTTTTTTNTTAFKPNSRTEKEKENVEKINKPTTKDVSLSSKSSGVENKRELDFSVSLDENEENEFDFQATYKKRKQEGLVDLSVSRDDSQTTTTTTTTTPNTTNTTTSHTSTNTNNNSHAKPNTSSSSSNVSRFSTFSSSKPNKLAPIDEPPSSPPPTLSKPKKNEILILDDITDDFSDSEEKHNTTSSKRQVDRSVSPPLPSAPPQPKKVANTSTNINNIINTTMNSTPQQKSTSTNPYNGSMTNKKPPVVARSPSPLLSFMDEDEPMPPSPPKLIPSVQWSWQDDKKGWIDYPAELCIELEEMYSASRTGEVRVDAERFIDLQNMVQRRYDARHKVRPVRRNTPNAGPTTHTSGGSSNSYSMNSTKSSSNTGGYSKPISSTKPGGSFAGGSGISGYTNSNSDMSGDKCFRCGKTGHWVRDCPGNSGSTNTSSHSAFTSTSGYNTNTSKNVKKEIEKKEERREDEEMGGNLVVQWYWKGDGSWELYSSDMNKKIEQAFSSKLQRYQVDDQRFCDFSNMTQRRYDDTSKMRPIKREVSGGGSGNIKPNTNTNTNTNTKSNISQNSKPSNSSSYNKPSLTTTTTTKNSSSSSSSSGDKNDVKFVWCWMNDESKWEQYAVPLGKAMETAYSSGMADFRIDDQRYVDFKNMLQRRYADPNRKRYVKRQAILTPELKAKIDKSRKDALFKREKNQPSILSYASVLPSNNKPSKAPTAYEGSKNKASSDSDFEEDFGGPFIANLNEMSEDEKMEEDDEMDNSKALLNRRNKYACGNNFTVLSDIETWGLWLTNHTPDTPQTPFTPNNLINSKISLWRGDITSLEIGAIVNAAKPSLMGGGGIDGAIHKAAGPGLLRECMTLDGCDVGDAKLSSGHLLPATFVIHTVGPIGEDKEKLRSCYSRVLDIVKEHHIRSVAFCCVSTGIYGYPNEKAVHVALRTVRNWFDTDDNADCVDRVIFCVFMEKDVDLYAKWLPAYFPPAIKSTTKFGRSSNNTDTSSSTKKSYQDDGEETEEEVL